MKKYSHYIGVDVSKLSLDLLALNSSNEIVISACTIANKTRETKTFFLNIVKQLGDKDFVVAFENTGVYSSLLACTLEELDIDYCQLSPLDLFLSKGLSRGKSDKIDAYRIAQYTLFNRMKLSLSQNNPASIEKLKVLHSQREKIVKSIKKYKSNKELEAFLPKEMLKELTKSSKSILNNLEKNLKLIEQAILATIKSERQLKIDYELVQSIPGIGPQIATYLIIVTCGFSKFKSAKKLACYAGVAPFPFQSGTSIKGRTKVSPFADKKLKSLLIIGALNAKRADRELNNYYLKKESEGKNPMLILNNIANKILGRVYAVINRQQPYINTQKFAA